MMKFPDWLAAGMMFLFCSHGVKGRLRAVKGTFGFERVAPRLLSTFFGHSSGTKCHFRRDVFGLGSRVGKTSWSVKTI
jgi:hypothetical protein